MICAYQIHGGNRAEAESSSAGGSGRVSWSQWSRMMDWIYMKINRINVKVWHMGL